MRNLTLCNPLRVTGPFTSRDSVQHNQSHGGATTINHELLLVHSTDIVLTMLRCGWFSSCYGIGLKVQAYVLTCACLCAWACCIQVHMRRSEDNLCEMVFSFHHMGSQVLAISGAPRGGPLLKKIYCCFQWLKTN